MTTTEQLEKPRNYCKFCGKPLANFFIGTYDEATGDKLFRKECGDKNCLVREKTSIQVESVNIGKMTMDRKWGMVWSPRISEPMQKICDSKQDEPPKEPQKKNDLLTEAILKFIGMTS